MIIGYKIYGLEGHRQAASFGKSESFVTNNIYMYICREDITGTNDYVLFFIDAKTVNDAKNELYAQISDGVFENYRIGKIENL